MTETYTPGKPIWCAGCGHFGVQGALVRALEKVGAEPHETMVLAGIGCSGTIQNNVSAYGYHALHGRVLPAATGVALANPDLTVVAAGGDGDGYAIGMGHLVHTFKRNPSLTYIVMTNETYGLTKGQRSPAAGPDPAHNEGIDSVRLGLSIPGSSFIARGFTRQAEQLESLTVAAVEHANAGRGFAFLEVLSPCVTYKDLYPQWDAAAYDVDEDPAYDPMDRAGAFATCQRLDDEDRIPIGLIYTGNNESMEARWGPGDRRLNPGGPDDRDVLHGFLDGMAS